MIPPDRIYLWTWDARPFPVFPAAIDVWSDGPNWDTGHWLTGRFGGAPLDALVAALLEDCGVSDFDTSELIDVVDGYVVDRPMAPRATIDPLALAFAFEAAEQEGVLRFRQRGGVPVAELEEDGLVLPDANPPAAFTRGQDSDLPREVSIGYTDLSSDYLRAAAASRRLVGRSTRNAHADLAVVSNDAQIVRRAEIWLQDLWAGRDRADFALPPSQLALTPGDVVGLTVNGRRRLIELQQISDTESRAIKARSIDPEVFDLALTSPQRRAPAMPASLGPVHALVLDLPTLTSELPPVLARLAVFANPWPGAEVIWNSVDGASFSRLGLAAAPAIVGETLDDLPAGPTARWHDVSFRVQLYGGALASVTDLVLLAGANAAAVQRNDGAWEVIQFANAELTGETDIYVIAAAARAGRQRMGDCGAARGRRALRAARRQCGGDRQRPRRAGADAAIARGRGGPRYCGFDRAGIRSDAAGDGADAARAGASEGAARRRRCDFHLDPAHAHRRRYLGGRGAARGRQRTIRSRYPRRR